MKNKNKILLASLLAVISFSILPNFVLAQTSLVNSILMALSSILKGLAVIASACAMGAFIWGVIKYVISAENEEQRIQAKSIIVYGVVSLFVVFSIWGIVSLFSNVFGIGIGGGLTKDQIPLVPGAIEGAQTSLIGKLLVQFGKWIGALVLLVMALAIVLFFWGVAKYILSGADAEKRKEGSYYMLYGVVGIFVMSAVWGLVFFLSNTFGVGIGGGTNVPALGIDNSSGISLDSQKFGSCAGVSWDPSSGRVSFKSFVCLFIRLLSPIPPILVTLALLYFFWGITKYIRAGGNSEELREGKNVMIYGTVALFVMLAVWGLVIVVKNELGLGNADYVIKQSDFNSWGDPAKIGPADFTTPRTGP